MFATVLVSRNGGDSAYYLRIILRVNDKFLSLYAKYNFIFRVKCIFLSLYANYVVFVYI